MSDKPFTTNAMPPTFDLKALQEAIKSMEGVRKPVTELRVVKSILVEQGAPMLLCHPDDFEFIKNAKLS